MAKGRVLSLLALATAGAVLWRRRRRRAGERLDLYFEDGSMVSLEAGSPDADRLLPLARDALSATRL